MPLWQRVLAVVTPLTALGLAGWLIDTFLHEHTYAQLKGAIEAVPLTALVGSSALTVVSFAILSGYDFLGLASTRSSTIGSSPSKRSYRMSMPSSTRSVAMSKSAHGMFSSPAGFLPRSSPRSSHHHKMRRPACVASPSARTWRTLISPR
jgi:hypothetical protein